MCRLGSWRLEMTTWTVAGGTIEKHADGLVADRARGGVPVLEHEDDGRAIRELIDQERKPSLGDRSRSGSESPERALTDGTVDILERRDDMPPQPRRVGIHRVERDPREGRAIGVRGRPLGKERAFPVAGRSADECERPLPTAAQRLNESRALEQALPDVWRAELGSDDVRRRR